MKKNLLLMGMVFILVPLGAQDSKWTEVADFDNRSLPQSALAVVNEIYQSALYNGDSPELIKSLVYKIKYETAIDNDKLPDLIREIDSFARKDENKVEQAVLYSFLAELYGKYYQANAQTINQRTAFPLTSIQREGEYADSNSSSLLERESEEEVREWAGNLFVQRIADLVSLSLLPANELQATDVLAYKEILTEGESSRNLRPTLYDFLLWRGIKQLNVLAENYQTAIYFPQSRLSGKKNFADAEEFVSLFVLANVYDFVPQILRLYQQLLDFRLQDNRNPLAVVMADLDRLTFVRQNTLSETVDADYLDALDRLETQYKAADFCVEVLCRKAECYLLSHDDKAIYDICTEGIRRYPHYDRIGLLQNLLNNSTQGTVEVHADNEVYPGKDLKLSVRYRNFSRLTIDLYKIKAPVSVYANNWSRGGQYKGKGVLVQSKEVDLINEFPYLYSDTTIHLPMNELGNYEYVVYGDSADETVANQQFSVSRFATVSRAVDGKREFLVVDHLSGKPVQGAEVRFYKYKNNVSEWIKGPVLLTDNLGLATEDEMQEADFYNVCRGNDISLLLSPVPWVSSYRQSTVSRRSLNLFTDRSIYRPGQTVYFKGIACETGKDVATVLPRQRYTLSLHDANNKEIATKEFTSNEWGSIAGEFVLPQGTLNGYFSIQSDKDAAYLSFRVEEYKRPTFDIRFDENDDFYRLGDEIRMTGSARTFSGVNLQDATVKYRIIRQSHRLFRWMRQSAAQVAQGEVQTQEDGSFTIIFATEKAFEDQARDEVFYTYTVEASITDTQGETQQSQTDIPVGTKSICLNIGGLAETVNKDIPLLVTVNALNLSGNPVSATGTYVFYSLKPKGQDLFDELRPDEWVQDKEIISGVFDAGTALASKVFKSLPSGHYRILLKVTDSNDKERNVETQQDFTLFSADDKRPPVPVYEWLTVVKNTCTVGEKAEIIYGSSAKEVYVLYEVFKDNRKLSAARFVLNNENKRIEIPFLRSYGDGVVAAFTFVKDGRFFTQTVNIYKRQPDKTLKLRMEVFRDRLLPGQEEEWKISVKDSLHTPVLAELLAGMYDASLDKLYQHRWSFNPIPTVYLSSPNPNTGNEFNQTSTTINRRSEVITVPYFQFDAFNWLGWDAYNRQSFMIRGAIRKNSYAESVESSADAALNDVIVETSGTMRKSLMTGAIQTEELLPTSDPVRQHFAETAFFYPQLKTNDNGETLISFTVPESNTTWQFLGLAHTKDLKYGQLIEQTVSQKQLMVTPNIPRFIREGDKMTVSSNVSNLSEYALSGTVTLECFDPNTFQPAIVIDDHSKPFDLDAGKTTAVSWSFVVPKGIDITALKIVAHSPEFSDGEQHLVPVLPNRMLVTESMPLNVSGGQTRTFTLDKLANDTSTTREDYRFTLEFTGNPAWYAVQALPSITTPQSEDVLSWFAAYYSNALATSIANSTPKIKQIIDVWTKQGGTKETLLSNLEKNPELKAILLEETPWVTKAQTETEQKSQLALLFDINRTHNLNTQALDKLKSLQTDDGGWAWFKGMNSSVSITQWILYGLGEMKNRTSADDKEDLSALTGKAVAFIDRCLKQHYDEYKKDNKDWEKKDDISTYELEYLFVRSLYKDIPMGAADEAARYYTSLAEKYWAKTPRLYDRAIAAIVLKRNGKATTADAVIQSLREHASHKDDLGMYWANNATNCFMTQSATGVHTFIMEAFHETGSTGKEMDEMKLWLLKQKQTQQWESVPATVNAISILLKTGSNWLESKGEVVIRLGDEIIDTPQGDAGTGYFLKDFKDLKDFKVFKSNPLTVVKQDAGPAWGALYWQYFEDLDKITSAKTGLNVEKRLFVEEITTTGKTLIPVTEKDPLKTGDKVIVRLTVRSDRDMEYVMLKDMRASCFEPVEQLSAVQWKQGLIYYQSPKDASMNFFFAAMPKGTYVFEYPLYVTSIGDYSNGITTIQCLYAPEFVSHTSGGRVVVE